ncbi:MAG: hypothetical protein KME55_19430 [Nostoc indistinguendum CM1-VF10]|nr:hypothetical protein [Nostoc indistinguendum CM1-VF10]
MENHSGITPLKKLQILGTVMRCWRELPQQASNKSQSSKRKNKRSRIDT